MLWLGEQTEVIVGYQRFAHLFRNFFAEGTRQLKFLILFALGIGTAGRLVAVDK